MSPLLAILILALVAGATFAAGLALVGWLQKLKRKNSPSLDPGGDEAHNLDSGGFDHSTDVH